MSFFRKKENSLNPPINIPTAIENLIILEISNQNCNKQSKEVKIDETKNQSIEQVNNQSDQTKQIRKSFLSKLKKSLKRSNQTKSKYHPYLYTEIHSCGLFNGYFWRILMIIISIIIMISIILFIYLIIQVYIVYE